MLNNLALNGHELDLNAVDAFVQAAQERGHVRASELNELRLELELDDDALDALRAAWPRPTSRSTRTSRSRASPSLNSTSRLRAAGRRSLQLFLNGIGRYPLLTASEEVALAKRVERGDLAAKERMVNCNSASSSRSRSATAGTTCRSST